MIGPNDIPMTKSQYAHYCQGKLNTQGVTMISEVDIRDWIHYPVPPVKEKTDAVQS